ncbi:hypothetical protein [Thermoactinospora rubra]|uniref:hypothetical protein n=1 Tax=Thermoactinospora rubra TaxID=1088767 RepID=UPI000A107486|nr:hypothetical protein [Thermoactinospora rubra]
MYLSSVIEQLPNAGAASAIAVAYELQAELERLNVPSHVMGDEHRAACSLWPHLVAFTDGRTIVWQSPDASSRGSALWTYARTPATAATRLAEHYRTLVKRPLPGPLAELALFAIAGDARRNAS